MGTNDVPPFKKDVAYARSAPFENYQTFDVKLVKITNWPDEMKARVAKIEQGIRNTLVEKGFVESTADPDILVQYALGTKQVTLELKEIDNPVHSNTDIGSESATHGVFAISVVDQKAAKAIWRVTAGRKMVEGIREQADVDADCMELLSEFPPL